MKTFALGLVAGAALVICMGAATTSEAEPTPDPTPTLEVQELTTEDMVTPELDRGNYEVEVIPTPTPTPTSTPQTCEEQGLITAEDHSCVSASFYEELPPTDIGWHQMDTGVLICGPGAKPAIDYNEHTGWGWWAYCEPALVD